MQTGAKWERFWFMWIFYSWVIANFHFFFALCRSAHYILRAPHSNWVSVCARKRVFEINAINQNQVSKNRWIFQFKRIKYEFFLSFSRFAPFLPSVAILCALLKTRQLNFRFVSQALILIWSYCTITKLSSYGAAAFYANRLGQSIKNRQILRRYKSCLTDHDYKLQPHSVKSKSNNNNNKKIHTQTITNENVATHSSLQFLAKTWKCDRNVGEKMNVYTEK